MMPRVLPKPGCFYMSLCADYFNQLGKVNQQIDLDIYFAVGWQRHVMNSKLKHNTDYEVKICVEKSQTQKKRTVIKGRSLLSLRNFIRTNLYINTYDYSRMNIQILQLSLHQCFERNSRGSTKAKKFQNINPREMKEREVR